MNAFVSHHANSIRFDYSCFDRMIMAGYIQGLQLPGQIASFLLHRRHIPWLSRSYFGGVAQGFRLQTEELAARQGVPILQPERGDSHEDLVEPYFQNLRQPGIAAILKARQPERIVLNVGGNTLAMARRWVNCFTFYVRDPQCGRMFVRICSHFPFNLVVWMNQHYWLAQQMQQEGIAFRQCHNCFVDCAAPQRLQQLSDSFGPEHIQAAVDRWVPQLLPFFSAAERADGFRHQMVIRQIEYCHNTLFHAKAAAAKLFDRLLDHAHALGHPNKVAMIFGRSRRRVDARTGEILVRVTRLHTPVLRAELSKSSVKQYLREGGPLRTETTCNQMKDLGLPKSIQHLPRVRQILGQCNDRFESVQQDVLETFLDRGQLQELAQTKVSPSGRRTPGLRPQDPRLLALLQAVLCFAHLVGKGCFRTTALLADVQKALGKPDYKLSQLRYDLGKLRAKGLVERVRGTQSYQLSAVGFKLGILYLKLHQRFYAPLTAGLFDPVPADNRMMSSRTCHLDRLYLAVDKALEKLTKHMGIAS